MNVRALLVATAAVAATSAGTLTGGSAATAATPSAMPTVVQRTSAAQETYAKSARKATNQARVAHDKSRLKKSSCLSRYATAQATAMAQSHSMYHQEMAPIQAGCNVGWVGENVAYGFATGTSVVDSGWMKSTGHRHNLLSKHYKRMGIGAVQASDGTWYVSQVFGKKA